VEEVRIHVGVWVLEGEEEAHPRHLRGIAVAQGHVVDDHVRAALGLVPRLQVVPGEVPPDLLHRQRDLLGHRSSPELSSGATARNFWLGWRATTSASPTGASLPWPFSSKRAKSSWIGTPWAIAVALISSPVACRWSKRTGRSLTLTVTVTDGQCSAAGIA